MIVYHGSYKEIVKPDIAHSRKNVDFGRGFYTTPLLEQAQKWCRKFKGTMNSAVVSVYQFDEKAYTECKVLRFDTYSEDWLDFILKCRRGEDNSDYDIVMGGVANDKVFNTVELFFDGLIDKKEAIKRLRYEKPNFQIAFRSQNAIDDYLRFERSEYL
jgi:hypothetical protein